MGLRFSVSPEINTQPDGGAGGSGGPRLFEAPRSTGDVPVRLGSDLARLPSVGADWIMEQRQRLLAGQEHKLDSTTLRDGQRGNG